MKKRYTILLLVFFPLSAAFGQLEEYQQQQRVISEMLTEGNYRAANAQARALVQSGVQAQLPQVEGRARFLLGRILMENPEANATQRREGIRELRLAAQRLRFAREYSAVDSIAALLQQLTGSRNTEIAELPSVKALKKRRAQDVPDADSINQATLSAIINLQNREITALADSQLRQLIILERQERQLDDYAFQTLNDSLLLLQQDRQLVLQREAVDRERQRRNFLLLLAGAVAMALVLFYLRFRSAKRYQVKLESQNAIISEERQRSEELLLNILPVTVAAELKETGQATARRFDSASVLFADFKGFSALAATMEPEELVHLLDEAFSAFDEIISEHRLEKIKTIGDAYMCAGGLPLETKDHTQRIVRAALAMQDYLTSNEYFSARIGIHSGPVIAGVVGKHKFVYDIWGDTVNLAARLEVAGEAGRVAISRTVCDLLGDEFHCEPAGTFQAKNIGEVERFFVTHAKS